MEATKNFSNVLSSNEMRNIKGGFMAPPNSCDAKATNCNVTCGCEVNGPVSCTGGTDSVQCNCDGYIISLTC